MTNSDILNIVDKFNNYMHNYESYPFYGADYLYSVRDNTDGHFSLIYEIRHGDWRHEHIAFKQFIYEFFSHDYYVNINEIITEEDDCDCYSAEYRINLIKAH